MKPVAGEGKSVTAAIARIAANFSPTVVFCRQRAEYGRRLRRSHFTRVLTLRCSRTVPNSLAIQKLSPSFYQFPQQIAVKLNLDGRKERRSRIVGNR